MGFDHQQLSPALEALIEGPTELIVLQPPQADTRAPGPLDRLRRVGHRIFRGRTSVPTFTPSVEHMSLIKDVWSRFHEFAESAKISSPDGYSGAIWRKGTNSLAFGFLHRGLDPQRGLDSERLVLDIHDATNSDILSIHLRPDNYPQINRSNATRSGRYHPRKELEYLQGLADEFEERIVA